MIFESDDDRRVFFEANRRFLGRALFSPKPGYSRGQTQDLTPRSRAFPRDLKNAR
jgi:hypothetical protein